MKKFFKIAAVLVVLLLLSLWALLQYRQYVSYNAHVPPNATCVIKVSVDKILQKIALNTLSNPSYYLSSATDSDEDDEDSDKEDKGISLPANIFIYSLPNNNSTWYTSLQIEDSAQAHAYITKKLKLNVFKKDQGYTYLSNNKHTLQATYNDDKITFAISTNRKDVSKQLALLLEENKEIKTHEKAYEYLKSEKNGINVWSRNQTGSINFNNGSIAFFLTGVVPDFIEIPKVNKSAKAENSSFAYLNINFKPHQFGDITWGNKNIDLDKLAQYQEGLINISINGTTIQNDTIITYEFNDDFEKVETLTTKQDTVPVLDVYIEGNTDKMTNYLKQSGIITSNTLKKEVLPLYQLNYNYNNDLLHFYNKNEALTPPTSSDYFTELNINVSELAENNIIPKTEVTKTINTLYFNGINNDRNRFQIKGEIKFNNTDINTITQLFEMLN